MMTEYTKTKAFLIALELDTAQAELRKAISRARYTGSIEDCLPAMKRRDQLTAEYWRILGVKE